MTMFTNHEVLIRPAEEQDQAAWMQMWEAYNAFYGASVPESVTVATWTRILDPASSVKALLATDRAGTIQGFANYVLHAYTWSDRPACLLDDLFVRPEARGHGAARALIEHLILLATQSGWTRLYWMTREDNAAARKLYNRFCSSDGFVRYSLSFDAGHV